MKHLISFWKLLGVFCRERKIPSRAFLLFPLLFGFFSLFAQDNHSAIDQYVHSRLRHLTINEGLSQNLITALLQDHKGFIWIGTKDGLNKYDGYNFTIYKHDPFLPTSLADNYITTIYEDDQQRLWIGTMNGGLHLLDRNSGAFIRFTHEPAIGNSIGNDYIRSITGDKKGNLWVNTNSGLEKLSFPDKQRLPGPDNLSIIRNFPIENAGAVTTGNIWGNPFIDSKNRLWLHSSGQHIFVMDLNQSERGFRQVTQLIMDDNGRTLEITTGARVFFEDDNGLVWIGGGNGLLWFDENRQRFHSFRASHPEFPQVDIFVAMSVTREGKQEIWIGNNDGLIVLDPESGYFQWLKHDRNNPQGIQAGAIIRLLADHSGSIWVGSGGYGLSIIDPFSIKFNYPINPLINPNNQIRDSRDLSIRGFWETFDKDNYLWIAVVDLYRVNRKTGKMQEIRLPTYPGIETVVYSIAGSQDGYLWVGSSYGLVRLNSSDLSTRVFLTNLSRGTDQDDPRINRVHVSQNGIWVMTANTFSRFDPATETFRHYFYNAEPLDRFSDTVFPYIYEDPEGNLWMGTRNGLKFFNVKTNSQTTYTNDPQNPASLSFDDVRAIVPDVDEPGNVLWIGTAGGGLNRFDIQKGIFEVFTEREGLPNNLIYGILADQQGNLWMSTNQGLSRFSIRERRFTNFTVKDGLQSNEFNSGAFYQSPSGEMFFGGIHGYNNFFPERIKTKTYQAPIVITRIKMLSEGSEEKNRQLVNQLEGANKIVLTRKENHFSIEFASLDYSSPHNNQFAYNMDRLSDTWIDLGKNHVVTFTDMKPGTYYFRVRGTNNDGVWSEHEASLQITILPPWWTRNWMIVVYFLLGIAVIAGLREYEMSRFKLRNRMRMVELETEKLKELDHLKSQFFANISHEFRTPLTLILGPVEQMLEESPNPKKQKTLMVMHHNAEKLLNLVNQLLELSKLEGGNYQVRASTGDLKGFLKGLFMSFASKAEQKNIKLDFEFDPLIEGKPFKELFYFDRDILEKIINNLLSNAFKFTPENGRIDLRVCIKTVSGEGNMLEISLRDSGVGIPEEKLPFIFDRFYQADSSSKRDYEGSGIGLAFVKELVKVHQGQIFAKSQPGKGTIFVLRLPMGKDHFLTDQIISQPEINTGKENGLAKPPVQEPLVDLWDQNNHTDPAQPLVLIVEDHEDVRHYISQSLQENYRVEEAPNAKEGLKLAEQLIPDLIISDIMMPGMDGFEFCSILKADIKTSHIPVILLTALAEDKNRLHGLETGADDYLAKPFNPRELYVRVNNLVESRRKLREKFSTNAIIKPGEISVTSRDQAFMKKLIKVVEENISNEKYSIEDLSRDVGMSQSQLHRKLKALVNQTTNHFVRSIKMHRAKELLERDAGTIAEVAYMVGYDDPGYFTKSFKAFFGILPSEVKDK